MSSSAIRQVVESIELKLDLHDKKKEYLNLSALPNDYISCEPDPERVYEAWKCFVNGVRDLCRTRRSHLINKNTRKAVFVSGMENACKNFGIRTENIKIEFESRPQRMGNVMKVVYSLRILKLTAISDNYRRPSEYCVAEIPSSVFSSRMIQANADFVRYDDHSNDFTTTRQPPHMQQSFQQQQQQQLNANNNNNNNNNNNSNSDDVEEEAVSVVPLEIYNDRIGRYENLPNFSSAPYCATTACAQIEDDENEEGEVVELCNDYDVVTAPLAYSQATTTTTTATTTTTPTTMTGAMTSGAATVASVDDSCYSDFDMKPALERMQELESIKIFLSEEEYASKKRDILNSI